MDIASECFPIRQHAKVQHSCNTVRYDNGLPMEFERASLSFFSCFESVHDRLGRTISKQLCIGDGSVTYKL